MGTSGLDQALARGAPLVEIVVRFRGGVAYAAATERFNALGDDIELDPRPWYDDPALRIGSATKEALQRLFGWRLIRVPLERYDEASGTWGTWPDTFRWEELNSPATYPAEVGELITSIRVTQPGADDDGQWYE